VDEDYFRQLTAEKLMTKHVKGIPTRVWKKIRARNEALDCAVYAFAAYASLNANLERIASRAEAQVKQAQTPTPEPEGVRKPGVKLPVHFAPRRGGWIKRW
jgi:phage terminase large subunit GpA-like protein